MEKIDPSVKIQTAIFIDSLIKDMVITNPVNLIDYQNTVLEEFNNLINIQLDNVDPSLKESTNKYIDSIREIIPDLIKKNSLTVISHKLQKNRVNKKVSPNNKVSNGMKDITFDNNQEIGLNFIIDPKNNIKTVVTLIIPNSATINCPMTPFDRAVHDAVCSIFASDNLLFTAHNIYNAMGGTEDSYQSNMTALEFIEESIEKLRRIDIHIDFTEEAIHRKWISKNEKKVLIRYLLPIDIDMTTSPNSKSKIYKLLGAPPLYEYSQLSKQIISYPIEYLQTKINNSKQIIVLRDELMRRILSKTLARNIIYETIFDKCDIEINNRKDKHKYRQYILKMFRYWKEIGVIKTFCEVKSGIEYVSIKFEISPEIW